MFKKIASLMVITMFLAYGVACFAAPTVKETKAMDMIKKAQDFIKANGKTKAFAEFNNPKGSFVDGEFYIFAIDFNGNTLAHGGNAKLVGANLMTLKDPNGTLFMKAMIDKVKASKKGWVDYMWSHPESKKIQEKTTYVEQIGSEESLLGCGFYK